MVGRGGGFISKDEDHEYSVLNKIRVIVVDDDRDLVDVVSTALEDRGIQVVAKAYDGEEASQKYFLHKPDVILLDMAMPNYDGNYAIEKIKLKDSTAKIIVFTAYLDKYFPEDQVAAVFSKTDDIDEIVEKIKELAR